MTNSIIKFNQLTENCSVTSMRSTEWIYMGSLQNLQNKRGVGCRGGAKHPQVQSVSTPKNICHEKFAHAAIVLRNKVQHIVRDDIQVHYIT